MACFGNVEKSDAQEDHVYAYCHKLILRLEEHSAMRTKAKTLRPRTDQRRTEL